MLYRLAQSRRERGLYEPLGKAAAAFNANSYASAASLARGVLDDASTDGLKAQASRLFVLSLACREDFDAAEVDKELRRHQVLFGEDPYLEGYALLKTGRPAEAVEPLRD